MTKKEHIDYWIKTAERDWKFVQQTFKIKQYPYALFFAHLVLEKLCKANWVKDNKGDHPPKIHNLALLANATSLVLAEDQKKFLILMNDFQLEGRYPDYKQKIFKRVNATYANEILKQVKSIRQCLLKNLQ